MLYGKITRRGLITGAITIVVALFLIYGLDNYCSSSEVIDQKTATERSESTKYSQYYPQPESYRFGYPLYSFPYQENSTEQTNKTWEEPRNWWNEFWCGVKFTDVILSGFTVLLVLYTGKLWASTDELVRGAENTAERQLKSYVFIDRAIVSKPPDGGAWAIHIAFKNYGSTPAYDAIVTVEKKICAALKDDVIIPLSNAAEVHAKTIIPPTHVTTTRVNFFELTDDWGALYDAGKKAYLWGRIDYIDAFRKTRWITFQMVQHFGNVADFAFCKTGNDSDKEHERTNGA